MPRHIFHRYDTPALLAGALAQAVAADLQSGLEARGVAALAVSGGATPRLFLSALSRHPLHWPCIHVTLVDERWVPVADARSNERLVRGRLLQNQAAGAVFTGLFTGAPTPEEGLRAAEIRLSVLPRPFDAVVLGMGADGHTASYFPHGDNLSEALDVNGGRMVCVMRAPGVPEARITLTLPVLLSSRSLYLHIEGDEKARVLAAAADDSPIHAVLRHGAEPLRVYWCGDLETREDEWR